MTRQTVESRQKIDIRDFRRRGEIDDAAVGLTFKIDGAAVVTVRLVHRTRGQIAGVRHYFECPRCFRVCEILFPTRDSIGCRRCLRLGYHCERMGPIHRNTLRLHRLRCRLGQRRDASAIGPMPDKPLGMRWGKYNRKIEQLENLLQRADEMLDASLFRMVDRLTRRKSS
jgi:hypothetical protein